MFPREAADTTMAALESVPAANRAAWRLHHVTASDTLATIARAYNTAPERIMAVNNELAANLTEGDTLLIPAEYHPDVTAARTTHSSKSRVRYRTYGHSSASREARASVLEHSTHVAAARRVSSPLLHRKAAVHTASVRR